MKKLSLFTLFCLVTSIFACKKENLAPIVSISTPTLNQSIKSKTDFNITGTVSDDNSLHEMSIRIVQASDGKEILNLTPIVHDLKTFSFNETWKPTFTEDTKVIVTVKAIDHSDLSSSKSVEFTITK